MSFETLFPVKYSFFSIEYLEWLAKDRKPGCMIEKFQGVEYW